MTLRSNFSIIRIRTETYNVMKNEAEAKGMKLWAVADRAINDYFQKSGGCD